MRRWSTTLAVTVALSLLALPAWAQEHAPSAAEPNKFQGLLVGLVLAVITGIVVTVLAYKEGPTVEHDNVSTQREHDDEAVASTPTGTP